MAQDTSKVFGVDNPSKYFPCSELLTFERGQVIYPFSKGSKGLYMVVEGFVQVFDQQIGERKHPIDIYTSENFFGFSGIFSQGAGEQAEAYQNCRVMHWPKEKVVDLMLKEDDPHIRLVLIKLVAQCEAEKIRWVEMLSRPYSIRIRLAMTLSHFAEHLAIRSETDEVVYLPPLSHELLSLYVGTSREVITHFMIAFREKRIVDYNGRKAVRVHVPSLRAFLGNALSFAVPMYEVAGRG